MKLLDREIVHRHLSDMEEALAYLKSRSALTEKELLANYEQRLAVERALHLAIQNAMDIGNHILASLGINDIETYADIPARLFEAGVIPERLSKDMAGMAKLRNLLVHEYARIESKKLLSLLRNNLGDFESFSRSVVRYLKRAY